MLCWQTDRQDTDLFDRRYVLKRVPIEAPSGCFGRERRPASSEVCLLRVERYPFAANQLPALDLYSTGLAAKTITHEIAPSALGGSKPSSRYQDSSYNFQPILARLIEERDVIFVLEPRHSAEVSHFATKSTRPTKWWVERRTIDYPSTGGQPCNKTHDNRAP